MVNETTHKYSIFPPLVNTSSHIQVANKENGSDQLTNYQDLHQLLETLPMVSYYPVVSNVTKPIQTKDVILVAHHPLVKNTSWKWTSILISSGVHFNSFNQHKTTLSTSEVQATMKEKGLPGFDFQMMINLNMSRHWSISSGMIYNAMFSVVDYQGKRPIEFKLTDVVIGLHNNLLSGQQSAVRGDTTIVAENNRSFRHRNEIHHVSIPLFVGWQQTTGRWQYRTSIGGLFSIYSFQKGKTFYNDQVISYNGHRPGYQKNIGIGISANVGVEYQIYSRWSIGAQVGLQQYFTSLASVTSLEINKPRLLNTHLTLRYTL
jgi:hypothetical protein